MACISQQRELSRRMTPRLHLLAVLQAPLTRFLHEPQERLQLRIPLFEEIPHLLHVCFRRVDHVREVVGTDEYDVVKPSSFQEIADGVSVRSHPVVDCGLLG